MKDAEINKAISEITANQLYSPPPTPIEAREVGFYWCRYSGETEWQIQQRVAGGWLMLGSDYEFDEDPPIVGPRIEMPER